MIIVAFLIVGVWLLALTIHQLRSATRQGARDTAQETHMAQMDTTIAEIDVELTRLADLLTELLEERDAGGMTAEQEAANQAKLDAVLNRMRAIGHNPDQPIPPPDPEIPA